MKARVTAFAIGLSAAAGVYAADTAISGYDYTPNSYSQQGNVYGVRVNGSGQLSLTLLSGEDQTNNVMKTEQRFSYCVATADTQCNGAPGFVHTITCATSAGAAATAGALTIRNALTETTPIAATIGIPAAAFVPFTVTLNTEMSTGIYVGFDGTLAGVSCTIAYRDNG